MISRCVHSLWAGAVDGVDGRRPGLLFRGGACGRRLRGCCRRGHTPAHDDRGPARAVVRARRRPALAQRGGRRGGGAADRRPRPVGPARHRRRGVPRGAPHRGRGGGRGAALARLDDRRRRGLLARAGRLAAPAARPCGAPVIVPAPTPLDQPGDPAALADLVSAVTGAAFCTGVLAAHLAGPASSAPGWLGADAAAAAEQVGAVTGLARSLHGTLTAAADRLEAHVGMLDDVRRRIAALRRAQEDDFASFRARQAALVDPDAVAPALEDLIAAEGARRHEHAALLAEVDADAAASAGMLSGTATGLGGTGSPGDEARVRAHLAAL